MDTDLNDLPAWVVQRMKDKDAEIDHLRAQVEALRGLLGDARAALEWPSIAIATYREQVVVSIDEALREEE